jgi:hypothetical protein
MAKVYTFEIPATYSFSVKADSIEDALKIANGTHEDILTEQDNGSPLYGEDDGAAHVHGDMRAYNGRVWLKFDYDAKGKIKPLTEDDAYYPQDAS